MEANADTYKVRRFYEDASEEGHGRVVREGLTLEEAQAWCQRDDTHGETLTGVRWFDGYDKETK